MSGVAGTISTRPRDPAAVRHLQPILSALSHRGADGIGQMVSSRAALGHAWLATDGAHGAGPYRLRPDGPILTCDLRLDDPGALAVLLGTPADTAPPGLVLQAYDRWGTDCVARLHGDFAFAIWDPARDLLFCARDRFGIKPLAWRAGSQGFAFASEPRALLDFGDTRLDINDAWVADFIAGQANDVQNTAWSGIFRLPPAHVMVVQGIGAEPKFTRYWTLSPAQDRPADVPHALREALTSATAAAMRGGRAGAMLSGGLDSSTVSLLARDVLLRDGPDANPLPVFLLTFPESPAMDERSYMDAVLATGGFAPHWLEQRPEGSGLTATDKLLHEQGQPFAAPAMPATHRLYETAARAGVKILLDGHGGDEVISYGSSRVQELIAAGDWRAVWRETPGLASLDGTSRAKVFLELLSTGASSRVVRGLSRRIGGIEPPSNTTAWRQLVHPDLVTRSHLIERTQAANVPLPTAGLSPAEVETQAHAKMIVNPISSQAFEILNRMAAHQGIEARYPFFDRRVIELCIAQPPAAKMRDGWTRALLRDAMQGVLPDPILKRRDKVRFNSEVVRGLLEDKTGRLDQLESGGRLDRYINMDVLRRHLATLKRDGMDVDALVFLQIWRAAWLDIWLQQAEQQPLSQRRQA